MLQTILEQVRINNFATVCDEILVLVNLVWVHANNAVAKEADAGADKFLAVAQAESVPLGVVN